MIALVTSVLNAQCAASCLLRSVTSSAAIQADASAANTSAHSCCPHKGVPQKNNGSCSQSALVADQANVESGSIFEATVAAAALQVGAAACVLPVPVNVSLLQRLVPDLSGILLPASITILRL